MLSKQKPEIFLGVNENLSAKSKGKIKMQTWFTVGRLEKT